MFAAGAFLSIVMPTAQGVTVNATDESILDYEMTSSYSEDWKVIKENVRAVNFEKGVSSHIDVLQNKITGKIFAQWGNWTCEVFPSDRSGYRYCFNAGYNGSMGKYYFNL